MSTSPRRGPVAVLVDGTGNLIISDTGFFTDPTDKLGPGERVLKVSDLAAPGLCLDSHLGYWLVPWSSGEDSWPTSRQRWFESIRDHWAAGPIEGRRLRTPEMRVRLPRGPLQGVGKR